MLNLYIKNKNLNTRELKAKRIAQKMLSSQLGFLIPLEDIDLSMGPTKRSDVRNYPDIIKYRFITPFRINNKDKHNLGLLEILISGRCVNLQDFSEEHKIIGAISIISAWGERKIITSPYDIPDFYRECLNDSKVKAIKERFIHRINPLYSFVLLALSALFLVLIGIIGLIITGAPLVVSSFVCTILGLLLYLCITKTNMIKNIIKKNNLMRTKIQFPNLYK